MKNNSTSFVFSFLLFYLLASLSGEPQTRRGKFGFAALLECFIGRNVLENSNKKNRKERELQGSTRSGSTQLICKQIHRPLSLYKLCALYICMPVLS